VTSIHLYVRSCVYRLVHVRRTRFAETLAPAAGLVSPISRGRRERYLRSCTLLSRDGRQVRSRIVVFLRRPVFIRPRRPFSDNKSMGRGTWHRNNCGKRFCAFARKNMSKKSRVDMPDCAL